VRSVQCEPEQIIVTAGIHQAIDLVARLLGDAGDQAWVEDPGYWGTRSVLASNGIEVTPVPVDQHGLAPDYELLRGPAPRFIFTTPSHQYPLGMVMSLPRRLMLIDGQQVVPYVAIANETRATGVGGEHPANHIAEIGIQRIAEDLVYAKTPEPVVLVRDRKRAVCHPPSDCRGSLRRGQALRRPARAERCARR
jgi:hypothetical protein